MKKIFIINLLVISLLLAIVFWSCTAAGDIAASLGQEFYLPAGKAAVIESEGLKLEFVDVLVDSRCPTGVQCPWAGEATVRMLINFKGALAEMVLTQEDGNALNKEYFLQYKINYRLEPYPQGSKQIAITDYYLVVTITK
jgi:hypothetical protein